MTDKKETKNNLNKFKMKRKQFVCKFKLLQILQFDAAAIQNKTYKIPKGEIYINLK